MLLGEELQIDEKNSNFKIFESALDMKSGYAFHSKETESAVATRYYCILSSFFFFFFFLEKVNFRSQILECPSIGQYWNIFGVPVLPENVILTFF